MGWQATIRAMEAAQRRQQRESKKRQGDLERQAKERAKLSVIEQARLEVETFENALDVLLSIHKEESTPWDWPAFASSLPPVPPRRQSHNELRARQFLAISASYKDAATAVQQAQQQDEREYQEALQTHTFEHAEWERLSHLSRRILAGEPEAYIQAIQELSPFTELAGIGSSLHFTVHNPRMLECVLSTNGHQAIPSEVKSLTATGKVSVKQMPKSRFIEIYQDYICGCVLRVARELSALLPVDTILITALAESLDTTTGQTVERPFLSVAIPRSVLKAINFDRIDPSDTIMSLMHRGDLKASRKASAFEFIVPLTVSDFSQQPSESADFNGLLASANRLLAELTAQCSAMNPESTGTLSPNREA